MDSDCRYTQLVNDRFPCMQNIIEPLENPGADNLQQYDKCSLILKEPIYSWVSEENSCTVCMAILEKLYLQLTCFSTVA